MPAIIANNSLSFKSPIRLPTKAFACSLIDFNFSSISLHLLQYRAVFVTPAVYFISIHRVVTSIPTGELFKIFTMSKKTFPRKPLALFEPIGFSMFVKTYLCYPHFLSPRFGFIGVINTGIIFQILLNSFSSLHCIHLRAPSLVLNTPQYLYSPL